MLFGVGYFIVAIVISIIVFNSSKNFNVLSFFLLHAFWLAFYLLKRTSIIQFKITIIFVVFTIITEIVFFSFLPKLNIASFLVNKSSFSILLASQIAFVAPHICRTTMNAKWHKFYKILAIITFAITAFYLLYKTSGRAGVMGFSCAMIFWLFLKYKTNLIFKIFSGLLITSIFISLFFLKENSSNGRLMIYKIVFKEATLGDWISGVGYGNFKVKYNQWQANYFSKRPEYSADVTYAENTYYAFNDFFQFILETGILGLAMLLLISILLIRRYKQQVNQIANDYFLLGAWLSLMCLIVSALFFYSFQIVAIYPLLTISLAVIFKKDNHDAKKKSVVLNRILLVIFSSVFLVVGIQILYFEKRLQEAKELSRLGLKSASLKQYRELSNKTVWNTHLWFLLSDVLYKTNQVDSALITLQRSSKYIYDDKTALLFANIHYNKGDLRKAESYFVESVNIVPKSYRNRFALLKYYIETKQIKAAKPCAEFILSMPYQNNQTINVNIRNQTLIFLKAINTSDENNN